MFDFLQITFFFFLGIFGRYVFIALLFQYLFKHKYQSQFAPRQVNTKLRRTHQDWREIGHSALTSVIFAVVGAAIMTAWQKGWTQIYTDFNQHSALWMVVSVGLVLFLHETYYYWLHRWMHRPGVYKWVHQSHHDSITTSAWTSFSFHPTESILQALVLPILLFIIPVHYAALGLILLIMTTTSVINHLNTEIYPSNFYNNWWGKWWIGATHHSLHHSQFKYNYGLYFRFWDKWMRTESPDFEQLFAQKTKKMCQNKPKRI
ncbi:MAG: sterol desaturase family protein [Cytophagia bacterium]|nr:MAG: sterol desaturase family protein [Cytophagales bacterium]TAG38094.1 MAG: sterol desaturase family protein [Cytophagia bacterium]TAG79525.1 MAG: sterol desaturase family protein [Cytophagales bacterium]